MFKRFTIALKGTNLYFPYKGVLGKIVLPV